MEEPEIGRQTWNTQHSKTSRFGKAGMVELARERLHDGNALSAHKKSFLGVQHGIGLPSQRPEDKLGKLGNEISIWVFS